MTTAAQTKAKTDKELENTFCLIKTDDAPEARVLAIKNVSGTSKRTKVSGGGAEKIEITYAESFTSGSKIITTGSPDNIIYTDSSGKTFDTQSAAGLLRLEIEKEGDLRVQKGDLQNVRLESSTGESVLLNGVIFAYTS
ncbi:hypothetical protein HX787_02395 [Pseudomonas tolaasii]|uniref:Uncharacterized protein n=2 Tax=Pseudomonas tolaasii TaxID=29442 RepID=A0A7Y8AJR7_PSETO|nr:hypothetical protein [Pseudomonas tolaasii]ARB30101.1 hypothetical protein B5P22_23350 [Pseudomonas tolaasii]KAB0476804.1 hypothetical protein F7R12_05090 [Pseudomonas tolaasii]MBW1245743.1 hypothetical protein [Pseudomonas tolaasii]MBW4792273.1 hypothetical protein [Pseudomonas tolaasii]MBY8938514.1 hypothetical protein [Pseudomonas tolaasii]